VTMTRPPAGARPWARPAGPPGHEPGDPGPGRILSGSPWPGAASVSPEYRSTSLPVLPCLVCWAAGFGALTLPELDPGPGLWPATWPPPPAWVHRAAGQPWSRMRLAHSIMARRYGLRVPATVGFLRRAAATAGRTGQDRPASWSCPAPALSGGSPRPGPLTSLVLCVLAVGRSGRPVHARRRPAARSRGRGRRLDQRPAGRGQPRGPGRGLDGGRIVRALAWARSGDPIRAGLIAARFGQVSGAILTAAGLTALALGHLTGLWFRALGPADGRGPPGLRPARCARRPRWPGYGSATSCCRTAGLAPTARGWQMVGAFLEDEGGRGTGPQPLRPRTRCGTSMASCPAW